MQSDTSSTAQRRSSSRLPVDTQSLPYGNFVLCKLAGHGLGFQPRADMIWVKSSLSSLKFGLIRRLGVVMLQVHDIQGTRSSFYKAVGTLGVSLHLSPTVGCGGAVVLLSPSISETGPRTPLGRHFVDSRERIGAGSCQDRQGCGGQINRSQLPSQLDWYQPRPPQ